MLRHDIARIHSKYSPIVSVYGSSTCKPNSENYNNGIQIGKILAKHGFTVANGGYTGIMDATAQGASQIKEAKVIGITTDDINEVSPSSYLTEEFREVSLMTRLELIMNIADIHLFLPGSTGTLTELSLVWDKQKLGLLPIRPILLFSENWKKIFEIMFIENNKTIPLSSWKKDKQVYENTSIIESLTELTKFLN